MSHSVNKATLIGNLGDAPEIRTLGNGSRIARFSVATTRTWTGSDGQPQERTQWHTVVVWDSMKGTFAFVERFLGKGDRVYVEGRIEYRSYEGKDGGMRYVTEIHAQEVTSAGPLSGPEARGLGGDGGRGGARTGSKAKAGAGVAQGGGAGGYQAAPFEDDDDLPF